MENITIKVTDEALDEIKIMLTKDYPGVQFSQENYYSIASRFLRLAYAIYRPIPNDDELPIINY